MTKTKLALIWLLYSTEGYYRPSYAFISQTLLLIIMAETEEKAAYLVPTSAIEDYGEKAESILSGGKKEEINKLFNK